MPRGHATGSLLAALILSSCRGPTAAPKPLKPKVVARERPTGKQVAPPKFDVAPPGPMKRPAAKQAPKGFVAIAEVEPTIRLDMRYATASNFTGAPLPGYLPGSAWLTVAAADALAEVQRDLAADGFGLLVFDAYRPKRATAAMVGWAEKTGRTQLLDDGYIARVSNHNRGNTVDLTLVTLADGAQLDMGTAWDTFSERSHYAAVKRELLANRRRLRRAMMKRGFSPYDKEWWHFTFETEGAPPLRDEPYVD